MKLHRGLWNWLRLKPRPGPWETNMFLISISACSLRKPMFIDKSDCHQRWPIETSTEAL